MDSTAQTALRPQKYSSKVLPLVTHGFDSANSPYGLRNLQRNCFRWKRMDSTAQTAPLASEIITESASTGDAWIRQRKEPMRALQSSSKTESLPNQKSSTKLLPRVTHGFDSANSPAAS